MEIVEVKELDVEVVKVHETDVVAWIDGNDISREMVLL